MADMKGEPCVRRRIDFRGENIYVAVGGAFVDISFSSGADHTNMAIRELVDLLSRTISELMGGGENEEVRNG